MALSVTTKETIIPQSVLNKLKDNGKVKTQYIVNVKSNTTGRVIWPEAILYRSGEIQGAAILNSNEQVVAIKVDSYPYNGVDYYYYLIDFKYAGNDCYAYIPVEDISNDYTKFKGITSLEYDSNLGTYEVVRTPVFKDYKDSLYLLPAGTEIRTSIVKENASDNNTIILKNDVYAIFSYRCKAKKTVSQIPFYTNEMYEFILNTDGNVYYISTSANLKKVYMTSDFLVRISGVPSYKYTYDTNQVTQTSQPGGEVLGYLAWASDKNGFISESRVYGRSINLPSYDTSDISNLEYYYAVVIGGSVSPLFDSYTLTRMGARIDSNGRLISYRSFIPSPTAKFFKIQANEDGNYFNRDFDDDALKRLVESKQSGPLDLTSSIGSQRFSCLKRVTVGNTEWGLCFVLGSPFLYMVEYSVMQQPVDGQDTTTEQLPTTEKDAAIEDMPDTQLPGNAAYRARTEEYRDGKYISKSADGSMSRVVNMIREDYFYDISENGSVTDKMIDPLARGEQVTAESVMKPNLTEEENKQRAKYEQSHGEDEASLLDRAGVYDLQDTNPSNYDKDNRHLLYINRFHLIDSAAAPPSRRNFIFMTRPDLNIFELDSSTGKIRNYDTLNSELRVLPYFDYVKKFQTTTSDVLKTLEFYDMPESMPRESDFHTPWLNIITNQAQSYNVNPRNIDTTTSAETFHGHTIKYASPSFSHETGGTVSIQFNERRDLSLYHTIRAWVEYMNSLAIGKISPKRTHIMNAEIDYAVSLFYISTDETMENILYWEKLMGVFPTSVPDEFFGWNDVGIDFNSGYSVEFTYSIRSVMNPYDLMEINNLYNFTTNKEVTSAGAAGIGMQPKISYNLRDRLLLQKNSDVTKTLLLNLGQYYGFENENELLSKMCTEMTNAQITRLFYNNLAMDSATKAELKTDKNSVPTNIGYPVTYSENNDANVTDDQVGKENAQALFLPNYLPSLQTHGIPYVNGPIISWTNTDNITFNNYYPYNNATGQFKLYWI